MENEYEYGFKDDIELLKINYDMSNFNNGRI